MTDVKRKAINAASVYLEMRGFKIIEKYWRASKYNIDIICEKNSITYFVIVKYLRDSQSESIEHQNDSNLFARAKGAAERWREENKYTDEIKFAELDLYGINFEILNFYEGLL